MQNSSFKINNKKLKKQTKLSKKDIFYLKE